MLQLITKGNQHDRNHTSNRTNGIRHTVCYRNHAGKLNQQSTRKGIIMESKLLQVKKTSRGVRIWIEDIKSGQQMANNGFVQGVKYTRTIEKGVISIMIDPAGRLKVAGKAGKNAIIDISAKTIEGFEIGDNLNCVFSINEIVIQKA